MKLGDDQLLDRSREHQEFFRILDTTQIIGRYRNKPFLLKKNLGQLLLGVLNRDESTPKKFYQQVLNIFP